MNLRAYTAGAAAAAAAVAAPVGIGIVESWSADAWTAVAAWITAAVAVSASYVALGQLGEARAARLEQARLRKEQAQPYVVAYIEFSQASTYHVDLVVKNFGATAAHDVRLNIAPAPRRAIEEHNEAMRERVWLPDRFPVLVPGQEWRTLWDSGVRLDSDLPDHHAATITYRDAQGESYNVEAVLDWRMIKDRQPVTVYSAHHAAQALRGIDKTLADWKEPGGGLSVYGRDGDAKDERTRELREQRLAERKAREAPTDDCP